MPYIPCGEQQAAGIPRICPSVPARSCRLRRPLDGGDALGHLVAKAVGLGEFVVSLKDEPLGAVLAVFLDLALLQHTEGLAGKVLPEHVLGIKDVPQFVSREAI